ncbi:MAG TPA: serine--tRNA ligase [Acidimicrobiia bacterium]|nr:serine--tRNA ligase [Acidimicrobiia bacterium]
MIDIAVLRNDRPALARSLARRGLDVDLEALSSLDEEIRRVRSEAESVRSEQKEAGRRIAQLSGGEKTEAIAEMGRVSERFKDLTARADELQERFDALWITIPNLVDESAADGHTDADNVEIARRGEPRAFDFEPRDHAALGDLLGVIDTDRGAKVSGSRFGFLKGKAVMLEFALVRFALEKLEAAGFTPMAPPVLVREQALFGTGFFPTDSEQVYAVPSDDLFLVGTSEVPMAAYHSDEILDPGDLPIRYAGFSTCFRREAGTYGKDTGGIFRVHQFDKVEMFAFVAPDLSKDEHERLLGIEEEIVSAYEVPYRIVNVAAGDLGSSAAKKYDIEAWFPAQQAYREVTSCSNTTDFQSRRLRIRMRGERSNEYVHTLNGTAVAVGRSILTILENHQQADGSVVIPEALRPYTGFETIEAP